MQVTFSHGGAAFESTDGKHLYFFDEGTNGLYRMPVCGGEEEQVASRVAACDCFSVTAEECFHL